MKRGLSGLIKRIFLALGIYHLIRILAPNRSIAILRYHSVTEPENNFYTTPAIALSPKEFERHVRYFASRYRIISLDEAVDCLMSDRPLPTNSVVFTFDDGYADNLEAARILKKYQANGTFYITTEPIDRNMRLWLAEVTYLFLKSPRQHFEFKLKDKKQRFELKNVTARWQAIREIVKTIKSNDRIVRDKVLAQVVDQLGDPQLLKEVEDLILTWPEIQEMAEMGMVIAAHTLTHLNLPNAHPDDAVREIIGSKSVLEEKTGRKIRHFSYPNSGPYDYFNDTIRSYVVEAGFDSSCTSNNGFANHNSDLFALERVRTVPQLEDIIHNMEWDRLFSRD